MDIVSLSNKLNIYGKDEVSLPEKLCLLSPQRHAIRKNVCSLYSFAVSDFLNIAQSERQVLLQAPTVQYRLRRLRGLLLPSRGALMSKLGDKGEDGEVFG